MAGPRSDVATEWRLRGGVLALRFVPVFGCLLIGGWAFNRTTGWAYNALSVEVTAIATVLTFLTLRARVRLRVAGLEVRELRTREYGWAEISWVEPTFLHNAVRLGLSDGSARTLPAPKALRGPSAEVDEAVAAVRLGPALWD